MAVAVGDDRRPVNPCARLPEIRPSRTIGRPANHGRTLPLTIRHLAPLLLLAAGWSLAQASGDRQAIAEPTTALRPVPQRGAVPADARIADYVLEARLDAEQHRLTGSATVTWRNTTSRTVDSLPFHLYMNGFRAEDTAWMQTSRGSHRRNAQQEEGAWGYINVHSARLAASGPLLIADEIENPPGAGVELPFREDAEPSTMTVDLPQPVGPGETATVELEFTTQLPRVVARTGYKDDFHAVGQWYPKIGVLEEEGGWQAHPFTVHDEFYADFGNYRVVLDVPEAMVVGAGGIRTGEEVAAGRKRLTYEAEMVHDFAWMADPDFVEDVGEHRGIRIRQLLPPHRAADAGEHMATQIAAIDSYENRYGPYPWSTITIIHPPDGARGAGGMEYPTLYTTNHRARLPRWVRRSVLDERVSGLFTTLHEFGHQYFQGLFASREHLEPWLDEGMNTLSNVLALEDRYGEDPWLADLLGQRIYLRDMVRARLVRAFYQPVEGPASDFRALLNNYGSTVYGRTGALMLTLRNLGGREAFDRALVRYGEEARFRHPTGRKLETILREELGERVNLAPPGAEPVHLEVAEYLDQALRTTRRVDFRLLRVENRRRIGDTGWRRGAGGELEGGEPPQLDQELDELDDQEVEGVVAVERRGQFRLPVELRVTFADGGEERLWWDGRESTAVFEWPGRRLRQAILDPQHHLLLEWQRHGNAAFAGDRDEPDGLSGPLGDLTEALSLAAWGGLGP